MPFQIHMCSLFLEQTIPSIFQIVVRGVGEGVKSLAGGGESEISWGEMTTDKIDVFIGL